MSDVNSTGHASAGGSIHVILGPMFSGKTTELIRRMKRFSIAQRECLLIKYSKDTRYSLNNVATHDRQSSKAAACCELRDLEDEAAAAEVIGIDEGQFFPDVVSFSEQMANAGKTVIIAALDGTFLRQPFGSVLELIPICESVVKLNAVCMACFKENAAFSKRISAETAIEVIGGSDKYLAVCRACYLKPELCTPGAPTTAQATGSAATPTTESAAAAAGAARQLFESDSDDSSS